MNTIGFMIMVLIIVIMYFFRYCFISIPEEIMNNDWYHYNISNGYYEKININDNNVKYYRPSNIKDLNDYDICSKYNYDKKNNSINMDCNKSIKIIDYSNDSLSLKIDKKEEMFFKNVESSLNHEFKTYYGKSLVEYKKEKEQAKDLIKINEVKLFEVIKQDEYSKIVFLGDKCTSIDCVLSLDVMEKWITKTENVYFFDSNNMNNNTILKLNKTNNILENNINFYNGIYPRVIITKNNKIVDQYEIKCKGFNCSAYFENEF